MRPYVIISTQITSDQGQLPGPNDIHELTNFILDTTTNVEHGGLMPSLGSLGNYYLSDSLSAKTGGGVKAAELRVE